MMDDHLTLALMTKEALDHHQPLTFVENIFPEILTQILPHQNGRIKLAQSHQIAKKNKNKLRAFVFRSWATVRKSFKDLV